MVTIDVEGYAAEKQLRDFSKLPISEQKRIRAERKKRKKERQAILAKISELQSQLCDKCRDKQNVIYCDCTASKAIRELGKRLGGEVVVGRPKSSPEDDFRHVTASTFNLQVYHDMKDAELSDRDILAILGWYPNRLNKWKREQGILGMKKPQQKRQPQKEIKGLTVEAYLAYKQDKLSDRDIGDKYGIASSALWAWKKENGLIGDVKPQQAVQQPKGEKMMNDVVEVQKPIEVDYKVKYETMKKQFEEMVEANSEYRRVYLEKQKENESTIAALEGKVDELLDRKSELEESLEQSQREIYTLTAELNRLKNYERDYRNLEIDFLNERTENERLKLMLDRLKHTAQINVWLMEQHVGFHKQLDEVMG